jgi:hypothetical protein
VAVEKRKKMGRLEVGSGTRRRPIRQDYAAARCGSRKKEGEKLRSWEKAGKPGGLEAGKAGKKKKIRRSEDEKIGRQTFALPPTPYTLSPAPFPVFRIPAGA